MELQSFFLGVVTGAMGMLQIDHIFSFIKKIIYN